MQIRLDRYEVDRAAKIYPNSKTDTIFLKQGAGCRRTEYQLTGEKGALMFSMDEMTTTKARQPRYLYLIFQSKLIRDHGFT